ncbi:TIGR02444 family protein [uncultured Gilvimarinus sp.]|uniref:TIGR02444 family protein n=1 Tax=uncultured Gilvimarinus sp. TaxID=1689143 RepID=UPI0030EC8B03|tara:strand:- start:536 stop:1024 length:489 start_codon:yes stop_codon:yes gene_type:complete
MTEILPGPLWDFALELYQQPDIEVQCLQLQDEYSVRIPMLLFVCWLDISGKEASPEVLKGVLKETAEWYEQVVVPLREARRWIKSQAPLDESQRQCRGQIKAAELAAERWEIQQLAELSKHWPAERAAPLLPRVENYLAACEVPPPVVQRTLVLLQGALAPV